MPANHDAKRGTLQPSFRETMNRRFGMGLSATRIGESTWRDRLCWSAHSPRRC